MEKEHQYSLQENVCYSTACQAATAVVTKPPAENEENCYANVHLGNSLIGMLKKRSCMYIWSVVW